MHIQIQADADRIVYIVDNRAIGESNISDYQDGTAILPEDIIIGQESVAIRLGRDNDMFLITGFIYRGNQICFKTLYARLRDGDGIGLEYLGPDLGRDLYGVTYGRNQDLYNIYGIRFADFTFVFDPRAPRTGRLRNPNTPILPGKYPKHDVLDGGCH